MPCNLTVLHVLARHMRRICRNAAQALYAPAQKPCVTSQAHLGRHVLGLVAKHKACPHPHPDNREECLTATKSRTKHATIKVNIYSDKLAGLPHWLRQCKGRLVSAATATAWLLSIPWGFEHGQKCYACGGAYQRHHRLHIFMGNLQELRGLRFRI